MGAVETTYTFSSTDTITSDKLNNIIDDTVITSTAILGTTLEVASGKLKVRASGITSNELSSNSVTTNVIADGSVTPGKLSSGGPQWTTTYGSIPNFQISGDYNFYQTTERLSDGYSAFHLGSQAGSYINATIARYSGANGELRISQTGTSYINIVSAAGVLFNGPSGISFYKDSSNSSNFPVPDGTASVYGARAWAILDGDNFSSTVTATSAVRVGTLVTVTASNHGFLSGEIIPIYFSSNILSGEYMVTKVNDNVFTITTSSSSNVSSAKTQWHVMSALNGKNIKSFLALPNSAGRYVVNFNIPMASNQFSVIGTAQQAPTNPRIFTLSGSRTSNGFGFFIESNSGTPSNVPEINISVFG